MPIFLALALTPAEDRQEAVFVRKRWKHIGRELTAGYATLAGGVRDDAPAFKLDEAFLDVTDMEDGMTDPTDDDQRQLADVVTAMVQTVLDFAETWVRWDGTPRHAGGQVFTPHKAIRRVADHLVDHLAEMEALLAGVPTIPDHWHASAVTTPSDLAPFTQDDLDEARSRLTRLAQIFEIRSLALSPDMLDRRNGDSRSVREIYFHLEISLSYAEAVGKLVSQGNGAQ
jgi:hypothetical protein